jgi:hypothetical protein
LTYATTRREEDLVDDLVGAGLIDSQDWVLVERREKDVVEVLAHDATEQQLVDLVADQIADVIFRLMRRNDGDFEFSESVGPRYNTGVAVDIDASIAEAEKRNRQWAEIEEVIPAITLHLRMVSDLTDRTEVSLAAAHWRVLAALHGEGSIEEVSRRLGMTDFAVAQIMAGLARDGLLEIVDMSSPASYGYGDPDASQARVPNPVPADEDDEVLLRSALSDVVGSDDGAEEPVLARRRGLGARVQEAKDAGE